MVYIPYIPHLLTACRVQRYLNCIVMILLACKANCYILHSIVIAVEANLFCQMVTSDLKTYISM